MIVIAFSAVSLSHRSVADLFSQWWNCRVETVPIDLNGVNSVVDYVLRAFVNSTDCKAVNVIYPLKDNDWCQL